MFTAQALKRYVTSNTHNPHCNSFHQEIWDISRLFTHFSCTTFPSSLRILHFLPLEVGKSAGRKSEKETLAFLGLAAKASDTKRNSTVSSFSLASLQRNEKSVDLKAATSEKVQTF